MMNQENDKKKVYVRLLSSRRSEEVFVAAEARTQDTQKKKVGKRELMKEVTIQLHQKGKKIHLSLPPAFLFLYIDPWISWFTYFLFCKEDVCCFVCLDLKQFLEFLKSRPHVLWTENKPRNSDEN